VSSSPAAAAAAAVMSLKQQRESCARMYASTWMCPAPAATLQEQRSANKQQAGSKCLTRSWLV
jgi:hypothetical protein